MDCFNPLYLDDPDFFEFNREIRDKNLSLSPRLIAVPCGHCEACIYNSAQEWRSRINEEYRVSQNALFVTLTYNDDSLPFARGTSFDGECKVVPCVSKRDIQLFFKRLRSRFESQFGVSRLRYFLVSEYGPTTLRPHYHAILFNLPSYTAGDKRSLFDTSEIIAEEWNLGFVKCDDVNPARIGYITKYLSCVTDLPSEYVRPFRLMSRRPAIGATYLDRDYLVNWHKRKLATYIPDGKFKIRMPRYYRRRIFDEDELDLIRQRAQYYRDKRDFDINVKERAAFDRGLSPYRDAKEKYIRNFNNKYKKKRKDV